MRPAISPRATADTQPHREDRSRAELAAAVLGVGAGLVMIGTAIWGLWVSSDVARHASAARLGPDQRKLTAAIFLLCWLVLFGPFLYFGGLILNPHLRLGRYVRFPWGISELRAWLDRQLVSANGQGH